MVGTTISHYKVIEKIGQGGIGEEYRGKDLKHRFAHNRKRCD